ncbi:(deoxy)nucleoside triphosphate pyrophosphohydrolase [Enterovibrio makurazakiensis]|uniref:8-oxo-dGTP diphosphatase n=1 Tax=Enterovibrio gelatinilyticus TaxID=2899819 RepID=A0ABT5R1X0_9GAMM|nr:(deoxy)nucleoside triphosphate pyrophosphohydrolase [Enterovibrio sp. ZSDZ42]MDD1794273.1 (deoxy)nucleoside triphosphate pyrophosphohydrolase [Enterovibrio sp. ZSDZ42]
MITAPVLVVAGVITDGERVLITQRHGVEGEAGLWEFPGGKVEAGETDQEALVRELVEELAINVEVGEFLVETLHHYPTKSILLRSYRCLAVAGEFTLHCHQAMAWVSPAELDRYSFSGADLPLVSYLQRI